MLNIRNVNPNKIRARKMAWMREETWSFAVCFIDQRRSAMPRLGILSLVFWFNTCEINFGCQHDDNYANGPNH